MPSLLEPTWHDYAHHGQELGLTVTAILQDFRHCGDFTISEFHVKALLAINKTRPIIGYTWGPEARRFILYSKDFLTRGDEHEENPPIFFLMEKIGFQIEDNINNIARLGEEKLTLRQLIQYAADDINDPILRDLVLRSHELGYTLGEIIQDLRDCHRGEMRLTIEDIRKILIENDIPLERVQEGRVWDEAAVEYVKAAYRIGLNKDEILQRLYTHGYDQKKKAVQDIVNQINSETQ